MYMYMYMYMYIYTTYTTTEHYLRFPVFIYKAFASNPDFHFTILSCRLSSLSAIKIKSSAYSHLRP